MSLNAERVATPAGRSISVGSPTSLAAVVVALGFGLRLLLLGHQSLWTDEILTVRAARASFFDLVERPLDYNLMPLYYAIVHGALQVSREEAWLRLPSVLAGGLSIAFIYQVGRGWFGEGVGLKGAFLMAVSPLHIWYSQEARPYALVVLLCLGSAVALQRLERSSRSWRHQLLFVLFTAGALYAHFIALGFVFLVLLWLLAGPLSASRGERLALGGAIVLLCMPAVSRLALLLTAVAQIGRHTAAGNRFHPDPWYLTWAFTAGFSLGPTLTELHSRDPLRAAMHWLPLIAPVLMLVSAAVGVGVYRLWRGRRDRFAFILLWVLFSVGVAAVAAAGTPYRFQVRYCLVALPPFLLLMALGLDRPGRLLPGLAFLAIAAVSIASLSHYFLDPRYQREDNRSAGRYLAGHALEGDLVLTGPYTAGDLGYYLQDASGVRIVWYPEAGGLDPAGIDAKLEAMLIGRRRFWLYQSRTFAYDPEGRIPAACDRSYHRDLQLSWGNVALIRYVSPNPGG